MFAPDMFNRLNVVSSQVSNFSDIFMTENMLTNNKSLKISKDVIRIGESKKDRHR